MAVVAVVTVTFIIVGDINFLAPIVTMPFLMTYACIDYAYFALAQTFDIQEQREERFRIQASSPSYETRRYGSVSDGGNDLDLLFPDRVRHKNLQSPQNSPMHQTHTAPAAPTENIVDFDAPTASTSAGQGDVANMADGTAVTVDQPMAQGGSELENEENEPIAPIRPPIHSKTKNWYSGFCNRWASLLGVSSTTFCVENSNSIESYPGDCQAAGHVAGELVLCLDLFSGRLRCVVLCRHS